MTAAAPEIFDPAEGVAPCDQIRLTLTNTGGTKQDVSVLYFTRDFQVQPIWPFQDLSNRLAPGESAEVGMQVTDAATAGIEEIWVLAVPVEAGAARVDLTRLAAPEMTRAFADTTDPMSLWLAGRLDPKIANRGFSLKPAPLTMLRQIVRLKPAAGDPAVPMEN